MILALGLVEPLENPFCGLPEGRNSVGVANVEARSIVKVFQYEFFVRARPSNNGT
jgi:hypothetical protein